MNYTAINPCNIVIKHTERWEQKVELTSERSSETGFTEGINELVCTVRHVFTRTSSISDIGRVFFFVCFFFHLMFICFKIYIYH